jgi:pantetheine-phosphate adenylyltransferase
MKRIAVYPGSFDPVTCGHVDLIQRGSRHADELVVSVLSNESKEPAFSLQQRLDMLKQVTADMDNVRVDSFRGLLVDYARQIGATIILRGIRAVSDFEYELQMAMMNRHLYPELETMFLVPSEQYSYLSSRLVREVARLGGDVSGHVPACAARALQERFNS